MRLISALPRHASGLLLAFLAGCSGIQSTNGRDGTQGALIGGLFDIFFWTTAAVYALVMLYLAVALFRGWNRQDDADSRAALLFETWAKQFAGPNFQSDANFRVRWSPEDPIQTPTGLKDPAQAVAMLKSAIAETKRLYGAIDRPFGEVSRFALDKVDLPGNGGFGNTGIFRTITWGPLAAGKRTPQHGETWVSLVEFSTPIKAVGLMSYGNASQLGSPHRADQLKYLSDKTLRTLWTTRAQVEQHLEGRTAY